MTSSTRKGPGPVGQQDIGSTVALFEDALSIVDGKLSAEQAILDAAEQPLASLLEQCEALVRATNAPRDETPVLICMPGLAPIAPDWWAGSVPGLRAHQLSADVRSDTGLQNDFGAETLTDAHAALVAVLRAQADRLAYDLLLTGPVGTPLSRDSFGQTARMLACHPVLAYRAQFAQDFGKTSFEDFCTRVEDYLRAHPWIEIVRHEDLGAEPVAAFEDLCRRLNLQPPSADMHEKTVLMPGNGIAPNLRLDPENLPSSYVDLCELLGYSPQSIPAATTNPITHRKFRASQSRLPEKILVCCHHKSGTNFLRKTFEPLAKEFDLPIWFKFYDPEPSTNWKVCFHKHSRIRNLPFRVNFRGVHCVRHPMGLISSAAKYHETCREPWVDVPLTRFDRATFDALSDRDIYNEIKHPDTTVERRQELMTPSGSDGSHDSGYEFAGKTYRQMLQDCQSMAEKLHFEMRCFSAGVVRDMASFPADQRFFTVKLEDISHDREMAALRAMFLHLGFRGEALSRCLDFAAKNCLWNLSDLPAHATTGVGEAWRAEFQGELLREYRRLFGWAEQALGYDV